MDRQTDAGQSCSYVPLCFTGDTKLTFSAPGIQVLYKHLQLNYHCTLNHFSRVRNDLDGKNMYLSRNLSAIPMWKSKTCILEGHRRPSRYFLKSRPKILSHIFMGIRDVALFSLNVIILLTFPINVVTSEIQIARMSIFKILLLIFLLLKV